GASSTVQGEFRRLRASVGSHLQSHINYQSLFRSTRNIGEVAMQGERRRPAHPLLYIIMTLLAINLGLTLWLVTKSLQESASQSAKVQKLPNTLAQPERERMFQEFRARYNDVDANALYDMFDSYAKNKTSRDQAVKRIEEIKKGFGSITNGIYSYY